MKKLLVLVVSLAMLLLAGETIIRKRYGDGFLSLVDPQLHHKRRPYINIERSWGKGRTSRIITNSLGWRDSEPNHKVKKIPDKKRILFFGDSFTEAIGFEYEDTFVGLTGEFLRKEGFDYKVLNAGTASFTTLLQYIRLKKFLDAGYKADLLVLMIDFSDVQDEVIFNSKFIFDNNGEPMKLKGILYKYPFVYGLINSSCLARSAVKSLKGFYDMRLRKYFTGRVSSGGAAAEASGPAKESEVITSADLAGMSLGEQSRIRGAWEGDGASISGWATDGLESIEKNIGRIKKLCDKNGIVPVVVIYPWPHQLYIEEDPDYYAVLKEYFRDLYIARESCFGTKTSNAASLYETVLRVSCNAHSLDLINLYPVFRDIKQWHKFYVPNDIHFNEKGHRLVAEKVSERLVNILQK